MKSRIFIFTNKVDERNAILIRSLLLSREIEIAGIYFSKPLGGNKGYSVVIKRLLNMGILNLLKIYFQRKKKFRSILKKYNMEKIKEIVLNLILEKNIPVFRNDNFNLVLNEVSKINPDMVLLIYFNRIIPEWFIKQVKSILNVHPGKLPEYRGVQPIFWALLNGEQSFYTTMHEVEKGIDTGRIIYETSCEVINKSIYELNIISSLNLSNELSGVINSFLRQKIKLINQDEEKARYFARPQKKDILTFLSKDLKYF